MEPYHSWPVSDFGPDELLDVQDALVKYKYVQGKKKKRYTRGGINDVIKWIRKIWKWGMGRQFITAEQVQGLEEVKPLRMGDTETPDSNLAASYSQEMAYYSSPALLAMEVT